MLWKPALSDRLAKCGTIVAWDGHRDRAPETPKTPTATVLRLIHTDSTQRCHEWQDIILDRANG